MEKLSNTLCCGVPASIEPAEVNDVKGWGIFCTAGCKHGIFGENRESVIKSFAENCKPAPSNNSNQKPTQKREVNKVVNNNNQIVPVNRNNMPAVFESRRKSLELIASPILSNDKAAFERLMYNNIERYPLALSGKAWDKVFASPEGQQSVIRGIEDAAIMGIELGKMGDLVPMGNSCTFIPSVEAFEFTLTNGNNAPFSWITIECIHENDEYSSGSKMGSFFFNNKHGKPRGKVIACAAYGELKKRGIIYGEIYDADRIMKSAEAHSTSYQYYLRDKKQFEALRTEGKLLVKNGREYFQKDMGSWKKDVYGDELSNPYDSDTEKMFMKATGKSVFSKFMKVRNSEAAMHEIKSSKGAMEQATNLANKQFDDDIIDGEVDNV